MDPTSIVQMSFSTIRDNKFINESISDEDLIKAKILEIDEELIAIQASLDQIEHN